MNEFASWQTLQVWYAYLQVERVQAELRRNVDPNTARRAEKAFAEAKTRGHLKALAKLVRVVDGDLRFISNPPFGVPIDELVNSTDADAIMAMVRSALRSYHNSLSQERRRLLEQFGLVHMARKVVGVGSAAPGHGFCCCSVETSAIR